MHTGTNIFPAIAVKTLLAHGMAADDAADMIRRFFYKFCDCDDAKYGNLHRNLKMGA